MKIVNEKELPTEKSKKEEAEMIDTSIRVFVQSECYPYVKKWLENLFGPEQARKSIMAQKQTAKNYDDFEKLAGKMFLQEDELRARVKAEILDKLDKYRN